MGQGNRKGYPERSPRAANAASSWSKSTASSCSNSLFPRRKLSIRADEFAVRISDMTGDVIEIKEEYNLQSSDLFSYAAWADKYDGAAHGAPIPVALLWR